MAKTKKDHGGNCHRVQKYNYTGKRSGKLRQRVEDIL
jgi:hypothetical protein